MIFTFIKIIGRAIGMPGTNPGYCAVALGHVAEKLAENHSPEAADDVRRVRDSKLAKPSADIAKSEAVVAKCAAAMETDNIKKRAAAQKECETLAKKIEAAKDPAERHVLLTERAVAHAERLADAHGRFEAVQAQLKTKGRTFSLDFQNLLRLIELGNDAQQSLIKLKPDQAEPKGEDGADDPKPIEGTAAQK